jgi:hypothetical protein
MLAIRPGSWPMRRLLSTTEWFIGPSRRSRKRWRKWRETAVGGDGLEPPTLSV